MVFSAALIRGLAVGVKLQLHWLFIFFGLLSYSSYCDACSSRSTLRSRPTARPINATELNAAVLECSPLLAKEFCLNGGVCFEVRFSESYSPIPNCFCADGFYGLRCELKSTEYMYNNMKTAGIAAGAAIAIFLSFVVCACLYVHMRRRRQRRLVEVHNFIIEPRPFDKRFLTRGTPESIQLTSLA